MATAVELEAAFKPPTTGEELLLLPDNVHGEIVNGVFVEMTASGGAHGYVTMKVGRLVGNFVDERGLGATFAAETAFRMRRNPDLVRCPDCAFVVVERLAAALRPGVIEGAPDLAVEVLSPSNTWTEMSRKLAEYFGHGSRQVWLGLPRHLEGDDVLDGGDLLPGFTTPVSAFFAGLPAPAGPPDASGS